MREQFQMSIHANRMKSNDSHIYIVGSTSARSSLACVVMELVSQAAVAQCATMPYYIVHVIQHIIDNDLMICSFCFFVILKKC